MQAITTIGLDIAKSVFQVHGIDAKHAPGTVPGARVTSAGAHTARRENIAKRRYTPEVGVVCLNWAHTDLYGGREVTRVPTAIVKLTCRNVA
jgi:hypothetical protein